MLDIPAFRLPPSNIFNFRERDWENKIITNVSKMLASGEKYGIIVKAISIDNPEKIDFSELRKTTYKILNVSISYDGATKETDLKYEIPWLMNNHFFVGGNYKVAIYQLYDKPVIYRSDIIKLRTNIQSFMLERVRSKKNAYSYYISMFGKKFPFSYLIISYHGIDGVKQKFCLNDAYEYSGSEVLSEEYQALLKDVSGVLQDQTINKDKLLSEFFPRKLTSDIIEDLKLVTEIDIFSASFMQTDNIVDELIYSIKNGRIDDCNYQNKRLRFVEQVIYCHLCKDFYNMITILKKSKRNKYSNNSKVILSNVNQSSITQFDFSINPLSELALLTRTSLSGPGGFEKQNVPAYLRDLHPSMIGLIDPSDTADRDGCGTIQYLIPSVTIDNEGKFFIGNTDCINSISIAHVPFLEHDDATRLQMSSSQQRHSIMLKKFDSPLVQSGIEGMYTNFTSFIFIAERDGEVIYLDDDIIIVQYDNKVCKAFHIGYRKLYLSVADFYNVYYKPGEKFKKNEIIAESNYLKNGRLTIGRNMLTAVMIYYGYNYEDGIVVSEKVINDDMFTSVHFVDLSFEIPPNKVLENLNTDYENYEPLPKIFSKLKRGDIYSKIRTVWSEGFNDVIFEPVTEMTAPEDCVVTDIRMYANKWDKSFPQYDGFVKNFVNGQKDKKNQLVQKLSQYLTREELENFLSTLEINQTEKTRNAYKIKGDSVDGVRIEITAMYERKLTVGDKIGNRHGNKGVISAIIPEDKMPVMPDGRRAEVIINPLGIISRMNIGQLFELHLAMAVQDLKKNVKEKFDKSETQANIYSYVMGFIKIIDKTKDSNYTKQMSEILKNTPIKTFIDNLEDFFVIQPPFESVGWDDLNKALAYTGTEKEYECFDPIQGEKVKNKIAFGYQYFLKLNHIAQDKIAVRGVGPYSAKTAQPLSGKTRKGGQRLGEMEMWAVIAHDAEKNLKEFISTKSDSIRLRNKYISEKMCNDEMLLDSEDDVVSQSLRLLQTSLRIIGLDYPLKEKEEGVKNEQKKLEGK